MYLRSLAKARFESVASAKFVALHGRFLLLWPGQRTGASFLFLVTEAMLGPKQ